MLKRGQAALEFLMTYGWAIMVVLIAIGALAHFGILSPDKFLPRKCIIEAGIGCIDFEIEEDKVVVVLQNGMGDDLNINNLSIEGCDCTISDTLNNGEKKTFIISGCNNEIGSRFNKDISFKYTGLSGLQHAKIGSITSKVRGSTGTAICESGQGGGEGGEGEGGGGDGPLDETASQLTANINNSLPADWHSAKGNDDNIVMKLFSDVNYDIYLENFTLAWNDSTNKFRHFQHLTEATGWTKNRIYGEVDEFSSISGAFNDLGDVEENLRIPANEYTIIDDLHFKNGILLPTEFNLTLNFNDSTSSFLTFIIG